MRKILVAVKRDDEWSAVLQAIRTDHYHLLQGRDDVAIQEELDLLLKSPGGNLLTYEARVVRVTPGKGATLEVYERDEKKPHGWRKDVGAQATLPIGPEPIDEGRTVKEFEGVPEFDSGFHTALQSDTADTTVPDAPAIGGEPEPGEPEPSEPEPSESGEPGPGEASTLFARVQGLSVAEKQKLALTGDRPERAMLARDNLKQVHLFVVKNPKVQDDEVADYVRYAGLSAQALAYVAENARWMRSAQLRFNLVKNPQVPPDVAARVIDTLSLNEVRFLAKAEHVKSAVRQAARKVLERKGMM